MLSSLARLSFSWLNSFLFSFCLISSLHQLPSPLSPTQSFFCTNHLLWPGSLTLLFCHLDPPPIQLILTTKGSRFRRQWAAAQGPLARRAWDSPHQERYSGNSAIRGKPDVLESTVLKVNQILNYCLFFLLSLLRYINLPNTPFLLYNRNGAQPHRTKEVSKINYLKAPGTLWVSNKLNLPIKEGWTRYPRVFLLQCLNAFRSLPWLLERELYTWERWRNSD